MWKPCLPSYLLQPRFHYSEVHIIKCRLGQGRERALQFLKENPLLSEEIEKVLHFLHRINLFMHNFMTLDASPRCF